jgi:hypothetical protein
MVGPMEMSVVAALARLAVRGFVAEPAFADCID